jgi:hypothetical protein
MVPAMSMFRTRRSAVTGVLAAGFALLAAGAIPSSAAGGPASLPGGGAAATRTLFSDDFRSGFDDSETGKWQALLGATDGKTSTSREGLKVVPTGTNPVTGKPAFARTFAQPDSPLGYEDHTKLYLSPRSVSTGGFTGFDVPQEGALHCTASMSATTTGLDQQPFGRRQVPDPQSDLRLAMGSLATLDLETGMVFDFMITNSRIYAFYERLPSTGSTYAAFSYAVPVAARTSRNQDTYRITLDKAGSRVTWTLNGKDVLSVNKIGTLAIDRTYLLIDAGGTPEVVRPRQLGCSLATFTLLDGASATGGKGLVRLTSAPGHYFAPRVGPPSAQTFVDNTSLPRNRLFGQGTELNVSRVAVTTSG